MAAALTLLSKERGGPTDNFSSSIFIQSPMRVLTQPLMRHLQEVIF